MQQFKFGDKVWDKMDKNVCLWLYCNQYGHRVVTKTGSENATYYNIHDSDIEPYTGQDEPRTRPMTRDEILHFVTTTPGLVVKREPRAETRPATFYRYEEFALRAYEWAHASKTGDYAWNKFEVAE